MYIFVFLLEIIGTISFAVSGAIAGLRKNTDIFGVSILGLTTATGGGVIRDMLLGNLPPLAFRNPVYALTAIGVSLLCFLHAVRRALFKNKTVYNRIMLITDSVGLGIFAVVGVKIAMEASANHNLFTTVFVAAMTAVGGGVLRDILTRSVPFILMKHVYAVAAIVGALICALFWGVLGSTASMLTGASIIFGVRMLSAHYKWNLPKANTTGNKRQFLLRRKTGINPKDCNIKQREMGS